MEKVFLGSGIPILTKESISAERASLGQAKFRLNLDDNLPPLTLCLSFYTPACSIELMKYHSASLHLGSLLLQHLFYNTFLLYYIFVSIV